MADLVTKLVMDNNDFEKKMKLSKQEIQEFKDVGAKVTGALGKMAAAFGLAMGAGEAFTRLIKGSQESMDEFETAQRTVANLQSSFWAAMNSGSAAGFLKNIDAVVTASKEAYKSLVKLKNVNIFGDSEMARLDAEIEEQSMRLDNTELSDEERADAAAKIEEKLQRKRAIAQEKAKRNQDAYMKTMRESLTAQGMTSNIDDKRIQETFSTIENYEKAIAEYQRLKSQVNAGTSTVQGNSMAGGFTLSATDSNAQNILESDNYKFLAAVASVSREQVEKAKGYEATAWQTKEQLYMFEHEKQNERLGLKNELEGKNKQTKQPKIPKIKPIKKEDIQLPSFDEYDDVEILDADRNSRSIKELREEISSLDKKINETTDDAERMNLINRKEGLQNIVNTKLGNAPKVETKVETKLLFDDGSLNYLMEQERKLIDEFNAAQSDEDRAKIYAELVLVRKKKDDMDLGNDEQDQKSKGQAAAESWAEGYSNSMANADFSTKEGREAVAQQTIDSIKALIIAKAIESTMKLPFPANIIAAPLAATAVAGLFSLIPKFEEGGVVGGNSEHGDKILARVNSGEMILNKQQQSSLYNIINEGNNISSNVGYYPYSMNSTIYNNTDSTPNNKVEFKIKGRELVGVLNNYNNKISKVM